MKHLALAGVDPHTVGSMILTGELVPASNKFRSELHHLRDSQRKEIKGYCECIEIGTGPNFTEDQMLKIRPRENVMALLACIIPFLDEQSFHAVKEEIFILNKVLPDQTPCKTHLLRLRNALKVLAQNTSFNETVNVYHDIFYSLFLESRSDSSDGPVAETASMYQSIPSLKDIPRIIQFATSSP